MPLLTDARRRRFLQRIALGAVAIPLARLAPAVAAALPHLSPDDPIAKSLDYTPDASGIDPNKETAYVAGSHCGACQLFHASQAQGDWAPCDIFTTRAVNKGGWCRSFTP